MTTIDRISDELSHLSLPELEILHEFFQRSQAILLDLCYRPAATERVVEVLEAYDKRFVSKPMWAICDLAQTKPVKTNADYSAVSAIVLAKMAAIGETPELKRRVFDLEGRSDPTFWS